jgi:hypothetical protein
LKLSSDVVEAALVPWLLFHSSVFCLWWVLILIVYYVIEFVPELTLEIIPPLSTNVVEIGSIKIVASLLVAPSTD